MSIITEHLRRERQELTKQALGQLHQGLPERGRSKSNNAPPHLPSAVMTPAPGNVDPSQGSIIDSSEKLSSQGGSINRNQR